MCNFGLFLSKFGCHGNSLGSLKNLDSIFEIADPENCTMHAKFVSISCTKMKLCLFECLGDLYHCGYSQCSRFFLRKIVEIVFKKINKTPKRALEITETRLMSNDVSTTNECDLGR